MKIIFFGSSFFSLSILNALLNSAHQIVQIVTTCDQKKGRGQKMAPNEVKLFALEKNLPVIDPAKLNAPEIELALSVLKPDFLVVAAYGKMIPNSILKLPRLAALNVHPSLLPKYRGASPIQSAILAGDSETGVSIAEVTDKLDAGDVFGQSKTEIEEEIGRASCRERV